MSVTPQAATLIILLGIGVLGGVYVATQAVQRDPAEFSVPTTANGTFHLSQERGRVVVLDFFATTCAPCKIVEANLKAVLPEYNESNVVVLSVAQWGEGLDELHSYREANNISWHLAPDADALALKYNVFAIPHMVILDAAGRAVFESRGVVGESQLRTELDQAIAGTSQAIGLVEYGLFGLAVVAGAAAFFSPCAIGMLPAYVTHAVTRTGAASASRFQGLRLGGVAAVGVLLVFFGIGGLALALGPIVQRSVPYLQPLVGFLLIVFGVLLLARPYSLALQRVMGYVTAWATDQQDARSPSKSFFAYGIGYGAAAAGCTVPILLTVLVTAAAYGPFVGTGIVLLYALTGAFLMVVVTVLAATFRERIGSRLVRYARPIEAVSALVLIGGGAFLLWYASRAGLFAA